MNWIEPELPGLPVDYSILNTDGTEVHSYHYIGNGEYVRTK